MRWFSACLRCSASSSSTVFGMSDLGNLGKYLLSGPQFGRFLRICLPKHTLVKTFYITCFSIYRYSLRGRAKNRDLDTDMTCIQSF